eukprot:TRINITY_DN1169_c0_g1_i1.p1 TRINITY_DN1169_c0_g1~~TRINITY_DN1169_c0_g1_i1.p1  ORF type:complete len:136 (+),score=25.01 TRINITY_DN1169_c0_g1_i1:90-497(+)
MTYVFFCSFFFFQAEDGIRDLVRSRGLGDVYKRQQLVGTQKRKPWYHSQPYGTVYIPTGTFHMGQSDEDIVYALTSRPKQVSIQAFFMDDTEITNDEYRQFVYWVRDSIVRTTLGDAMGFVINNNNGTSLSLIHI